MRRRKGKASYQGKTALTFTFGAKEVQYRTEVESDILTGLRKVMSFLACARAIICNVFLSKNIEYQTNSVMSIVQLVVGPSSTVFYQ